MAHSIAYLNARIKLRARHLLEWEALADNQKKVWRLIDEEYSQKLSLCNNDDEVSFLKRKQAERHRRMMIDHRIIREKLKANHQHDFSLLEESVKVSSLD